MRLSLLRTLCATAILAVVALLGMAQPARAAFEVVVTDSAGDPAYLFTDNTNSGTISYTGPGFTIGNFTVTALSATAPPALSSTAVPGQIKVGQLTTQVNTSGNSAESLYITEVVTSLGSTGALGVTNTVNASSIDNGQYSFQSWIDYSNPLPSGFSSSVTPAGTTGTAAGPYTTTAGGSTSFNAAAGTFAVINQVTFTTSGGISDLSDTATTKIVVTTGDFVGVVPAPTSGVLALIGIPVVALGFLARRMTRKAPAAA